MIRAPLAVIVATALATIAIASTPPAPPSSSLRVAQRAASSSLALAPDFDMTLLDGRRVSSTALGGRTIVLDFWGTWCPPCRAATPSLVAFAGKFASDPGFVMIGVSTDDATDTDAVREYVGAHKMSWLHTVDLQERLVSLFHIDDFPTYVVIDGTGRITARLMGWPRAAKGSTVPPGTAIIAALESAVKASLRQQRTAR